MILASGIGSWPGTDIDLTCQYVRDDLRASDAPAIAYLPELPARGPGADMVGRAVAFLPGFWLELQPSGWRFAAGAGVDQRRAEAWVRHDFDALVAALDGYAGPLKIQVTGPWTMAASVELPRGEPALGDNGACRDLAQSLQEGLRDRVAWMRRHLPHAEFMVQLDEPSVPAVLEGRVPTASGLGRVGAADPQRVVASLHDVCTGVPVPVTVHCCALDVPFALLRRAGTAGVAFDASLLTMSGWEQVAETVESGHHVWAGLALPPAVTSMSVDALAAQWVRAVAEPWRRVGLGEEPAQRLVLTPPCGLAGVSVDVARQAHQALVLAAQRLPEVLGE